MATIDAFRARPYPEPHPLLTGMVQYLPADGRWTRARRDLWLDACTKCVDMLIRVLPDPLKLPPPSVTKSQGRDGSRPRESRQDEEQRRFVEILSGLTKHIKQPAYVFGRPRLPLADVVFACVYTCYWNLSTRQVVPKLRELYEKGVVSSLFHHNSISNYMCDPTLTPVLEMLVHTASELLGSPKTGADTEAEWDRTERKLETMHYRGKDDRSGENTSLCMTLGIYIWELMSSEAD